MERDTEIALNCCAGTGAESSRSTRYMGRVHIMFTLAPTLSNMSRIFLLPRTQASNTAVDDDFDSASGSAP